MCNLYKFKTVFFCLMSLTVISCTESNNLSERSKEKQNDFFVEMQERFREVGVSNIIDNYILQKDEVTSIKEISSILDKIQSPEKVATHKIIYEDGSVAYAFKIDEDFSVVKINNKQIIREFKCNYSKVDNEAIFSVKENGIESIYSISKNNELLRSANCHDLGGRRLGESFGNCFQRNWNNFCCDFIGCVAQITSPYAVAAAIALTCACT